MSNGFDPPARRTDLNPDIDEDEEIFDSRMEFEAKEDTVGRHLEVPEDELNVWMIPEH